jgi:HlyD family secretion protein
MLLLGLTLAACGDSDRPASFQGYLEGEYLRIAAPEGGWLVEVAVREGQIVPAGAPLFALDATREEALVAEARARLAQAESELADLSHGARPEEIAALEAQLAEAEAGQRLAGLELDRQHKLESSNVAAKARLDEARTEATQAAARVERMRAELATARLAARSDRIDAARAGVEAARASLEQALWRLGQRAAASSVAALVDDIVRDPGEWVPANGTVVSLLPPGAIKVVFFVPEPSRAAIQPGDLLAVACTGCPVGLTAKVTRIASEAEYTPPVIFSEETRAKLVYRAEAALAAEGLAATPGQPVTVEPVS